MKNYLWLLFFMLLFACNRPIKEYYANGKIKRIYNIVNDKYEGMYQIFDTTGSLKETHIYEDGIKIDSSVYFNKNDKINYIDFYIKDSLTERRYYYKNGTLKEKGKLNENNLPVHKWEYYNKEGILTQIKEIWDIKGKSHLNQDWVFNKSGDTIKNKGSYFSIKYENDTIDMDKPIQAVVNLKSPLFKNRKSEIMVIVPKDYSINFNDDFSNLENVQKDTIYNLNEETELKKELGLEGNYKLTSFFGRYFNKPGLKKFRGIIVEYYYTDSITPDSLNYFEHKKYFEKDIYVKGSKNEND